MKRIISALLVCILMVGCVFALASCGGPNKDPLKAKEALEEAGYTVVFRDTLIPEGVEYTINASKDKLSNTIVITWYEDVEDAKEAEAEYKELFEKEKEEDPEETKKSDYGRSGNMVWMGTKEAIKAAK